MNSRPRILLDCDPGIDDAFAIFCALRYADLAAVTTVSGNVPIDHTTRNALYLLELAGSTAAVHRGAAVPLQVPARFADSVHGAAGLGARETPTPSRTESDIDAVDAIIEFCADGDATIVATGPLTNIALAALRDPTLSDRIAHLHWMGGSTTTGNVTPVAEFNAWADPHAVDVTLRSGMPLTMYGLNLTYQVRMGGEHIDILRGADSKTSREAAEYLSFYKAHAVQDTKGQPMHDPCAVLGVTHPELFSYAASSIVAHSDDDRRGVTEVESSTVGTESCHRVACDTNADLVIERIVEAAIDPTPPT